LSSNANAPGAAEPSPEPEEEEESVLLLVLRSATGILEALSPLAFKMWVGKDFTKSKFIENRKRREKRKNLCM
jgi:hypothetical protein